jgi:prophage regulatory protein
MPTNTADKLLRLPALIDCVGISRSTIYRLIDLGRFPRPIRIGLAAVAWRQSDVDEWIASSATWQTPRERNSQAS